MSKNSTNVLKVVVVALEHNISDQNGRNVPFKWTRVQLSVLFPGKVRSVHTNQTYWTLGSSVLRSGRGSLM